MDDHARALVNVVFDGELGETCNISGHNEYTNLHVVETLCDMMDIGISPKPPGNPKLARFYYLVADHPNHDRRYVIFISKIVSVLGWTPQATFESGLAKTVD